MYLINGKTEILEVDEVIVRAITTSKTDTNMYKFKHIVSNIEQHIKDYNYEIN